MSYSAIPDTLRERDNWVCWRIEVRDGNRTKIPIDPHTGSKARSDDPETWGTFAEAGEHAARDDMDGIGLMLSESDTLAAVDFDDVREVDPETGEVTVSDWAGEAIAALDSYTEISPSGTGFHVWLFGFKPGDRCKIDVKPGEDIELYDSSDDRFLTVTGDRVPEPPETVEQRNAVFGDLYREHFETDQDSDDSGQVDHADHAGGNDLEDQDLIEKAKHAENAAKFSRLWNGDTSDYESHSEADLALAGMLGFWTGGDRDRIDRLMRRSGLMREKWDRDDYRERTIDKALSGRSEFYKPAPAASTDGGTAVQSGNAETGDPDDPDDADPWAEVRAIYEDTEATNSRAHTLAVDLLLTERPVFTARETDRIYAYDDETGYYHEHGATEVKRHLVDQLGDAYRTKREHEILARLRGKTYVPIDQVGAPDGLLCVGNGVLDLRDLPGGDVELLDHDPEYQFLTGLPVDYDPDADCPRFREVVSDIVNDRHIETLQEYVGYTLAPWGQPFKRAVVCLGPKDSGKSTVLNVVAAMLGDKQNVANQNLYAIMNTRWGTAQLHGKMANITNELGTEALENIGLWKTLTGGERLVDAERKGEQKFQFRPTTKHLFATNHLPPADGADEAFHERFLHILFPKEVPASDRVRNLDQKIIDDELTGVLNWAIDGYRRLLDQDGFDFDPLVGEKRERWEAYGNSIERFKHNCFELTGDPDDVIVKSIGYDLYTAYCEHAGLDVESPKKVTTKLKEDKHISDGRRKAHPDDKRRTAYVGVRFNDDALDALNFDPGAKLDELQQDADNDEAIDEETYTGGLDQFD